MFKRRLAAVNVFLAATIVLFSSGGASALAGPRSYVNEETGDVFLGGDYIELGISRLGSFGTTETYQTLFLTLPVTKKLTQQNAMKMQIM